MVYLVSWSLMTDVKSVCPDNGYQNKKLKIIVVSNVAEVLCISQAATNFYFGKCLSGMC